MNSINFLDINMKLEKIHSMYIEPNKRLFEDNLGFTINFNKNLDIESKRAEITAHFLLATNDRALKNQETQVERSLGPDQTELCALVLATYGLTLLHEWTIVDSDSESSTSFDKDSLNNEVNSFLNIILEIYKMQKEGFEEEDIQENIHYKFEKKYIKFKNKYLKYKSKYIKLKKQYNI